MLPVVRRSTHPLLPLTHADVAAAIRIWQPMGVVCCVSCSNPATWGTRGWVHTHKHARQACPSPVPWGDYSEAIQGEHSCATDSPS